MGKKNKAGNCEAMQQLIDEAAENAAREAAAKATAKEQERTRKAIAKANAKAEKRMLSEREKTRKDFDKRYVESCQELGVPFASLVQKYAEKFHTSKKAASAIIAEYWV